jgi:hypothetical protein
MDIIKDTESVTYNNSFFMIENMMVVEPNNCAQIVLNLIEAIEWR